MQVVANDQFVDSMFPSLEPSTAAQRRKASPGCSPRMSSPIASPRVASLPNLDGLRDPANRQRRQHHLHAWPYGGAASILAGGEGIRLPGRGLGHQHCELAGSVSTNVTGASALVGVLMPLRSSRGSGKGLGSAGDELARSSRAGDPRRSEGGRRRSRPGPVNHGSGQLFQVSGRSRCRWRACADPVRKDMKIQTYSSCRSIAAAFSLLVGVLTQIRPRGRTRVVRVVRRLAPLAAVRGAEAVVRWRIVRWRRFCRRRNVRSRRSAGGGGSAGGDGSGGGRAHPIPDRRQRQRRAPPFPIPSEDMAPRAAQAARRSGGTAANRRRRFESRAPGRHGPERPAMHQQGSHGR